LPDICSREDLLIKALDDLEKGDILLEKGDILFEKGDILLEKGDILFEKGDILLEKGDILLTHRAHSGTDSKGILP
jgi:hypothetical protein